MLDDENKETEDETEENTLPTDSDNARQDTSEEKPKNSISADLIRGHINTIILRTLSERDKYGYEIIEEIEKKSHGQYELKQPTLYSALKRLENQGYIKAYWKTDEISAGGRRKYFTLTDSGREITEKNRAEWEYSRTVIDSLISDQAFDFSKPAPTPVDFKILKKSTSRVPNLRETDDDDEDETEQPEEKNDSGEAAEALVEYTYAESLSSNITLNDIQFSEQKQSDDEQEAVQSTQEQQPDVPLQQQAAEQPVETEPVQQTPEPMPEPAPQPMPEPAPQYVQQPEPQAMQPAQPQPNEQLTQDSAQYQKLHENYLKLLDENYGKAPVQEPAPSYGDNIDTEKLIYNNKPVTERDYKNLINDMYSQTIRSRQPTKSSPAAPQQPVQPVQTRAEAPAPASRVPENDGIRIMPAYKPHTEETRRAENDGLRLYTSDAQVKPTGKYSKSYNIGETLLKCSGVVFAYLMILFIISLVCKSALGVTLVYPFMIFAIACAIVFVCAGLALGGFGKNAIKPVTHGYIAVSLVLTVIAIFIVCVVAILLDINFGSAAEICKMILIPSFVLLSAPLFTSVYYLFIK